MSHHAWLSINSGANLVSSFVANVGVCAIRAIRGIWIPHGNSTGVVYIQVFDAASLPNNGTVPLTQISICYPSNTNPFNFDIDFRQEGLYISNGIVIASSTTCPTLTLDGAQMHVGVRYR